MSTTNTRAPWPTTMLLPGQAAAPEGPVDMTMMYVMHHAFRRDLAAFASAAAATPLRDRATWQALAARWELFATALHHHHSGEDAGLWPLLMARTDAAGKELLTAMEDEHSEIDPILQACEVGFSRLATTADEDARAALVVRLTAGRESLARHLAHEETDAIVLAQQVMTNEEWDQVQEEHFVPKDVPARLLLQLLPWITSQLPLPARDRLLASVPLVHRVVWRLARPGFERRERRAFAYVTR